MSRFRNWCFTFNGGEIDEENRYPILEMEEIWWMGIKHWENVDIIQYVVLQEEVGESGNVHLQGYIELKRAVRLTKMKSLFGSRYWFGKREGTQDQAIAYCKKKENTGGFKMEYGTPKRTGKGGHFGTAVHAIVDGMSIADVEDMFPVQYCMYKDKLENMAMRQRPSRDWAMDIQIYFGESGTGKSATAQTRGTDFYVVPWPTGGRWWWPDYRGEYIAVMDEFRHQIKMDVMLKMFDRYVWHLEFKGSNMLFKSHVIIITTNIDPKDWYPKVSRRAKAPLARRIREFATIWDFSADNQYPGPWNKTMRPKVNGKTVFEFNEPEIPQGGYNFGVVRSQGMG